MQRLHLAVTTGLVIAVAVLSTLLIRRSGEEGSPPPAAPAVPQRRIERVPDAEMTLKRLGYAAWVYRWSGGMIDGEFRLGPGLPSQGLGGAPLSRDLRAFVKASGSDATGLDSLSGMVIVLIGPLKRGVRPPTFPCRVYIYGESGSSAGSREPAEMQVAYSDMAAEGEMSVEAYGKWREHAAGGTYSPDPESKYPLLKLRWLEE